jgi:hypothetical protein
MNAVDQLINDLTNASEERLAPLRALWASLQERAAPAPTPSCSPQMAMFRAGKMDALQKYDAQVLRDLWCELLGKPTGAKSSGKLMKRDLIRHIFDLAELPERIMKDYTYKAIAAAK